LKVHGHARAGLGEDGTSDPAESRYDQIVQTIQLVAGSIAITALAVFAVFQAQRSKQWTPALITAMSLLAAVSGAVLVLVLSTDLVPDQLERMVLPIILFIAAPLAFIAGWLWVRSRL
jgi:uncharacterized membrane protein